MKKSNHFAGRYLSILAVCLFALLGSASAIQASNTDTHANQFDIVSANSSYSKWTTRVVRTMTILKTAAM